MRKAHAIIWPIVVTVIPFLLYLRTLCPVIYAGDSSEFASVVQLPTIAHPPGSPLYTILGYLFTRLPLGNPAYEANLFSAFFGALTCLVMYFCFLRLTARHVTAASAALLLSFGIIFWRLSSIAEVYTLLMFFIALVWLVALRLTDGGMRPGWKGFLLLGLLFGLGFAVHQSIIFILPGLIVFFILKRGAISPKSAITGAVLGFLIGLACYLVLIPISQSSSPGSHEINGIADLWRYATRQVYFERTPEDVGVEFTRDDLVTSGDIAKGLFTGIWREWGPIFFFFTVGGVIYLIFRRRSLGWGIVVSIVSVFLGMSFLTKGSPLGMPKIDLDTAELIPPLLPLFAFGFLAALDGAYEKLLSTDQFVGEESFIPREKVPTFLGGFYIAFPILLMLFHFGTADMRNHKFVDMMVRNSLQGISTPATIYTVGDEYYPFRYILQVEQPFVSADGSPADIQLLQSWNMMGVTESGKKLSPDESLASKINQDIDGGRRVFLTLLPSEPVIGMLKGAGVHFEHVGLIYEAVPDSASWAAPGDEPIRFANPGREAGIWELYDLDHLQVLDYVELDPLEVFYIDRYYQEAVNYSDFYFNQGVYDISWSFLDKAVYLAQFVGRESDPIIPHLAISSYHIKHPKTLDYLEYAVENGIEFPERDPYRANLYLKVNPSAGLQLGREIYSDETTALVDFELIEALMAEDIDNDDLDAAEEKVLVLMKRTTGYTWEELDRDAKIALKPEIAHNTNAAKAFWHMGYISALKDDMDTVRAVVELLLDSNPDFLNGMVDMLVRAEDFEKAKLFYEITLEFEPENWRAMEGLAVCLFALDEEEKAVEIAGEVIKHRPESKNLKHILGIEIEGDVPESSAETDDAEPDIDEGSE